MPRVIFAFVSVLTGCSDSAAIRDAAGTETTANGLRHETVESKLARVGLELITESEAAIPESERGRWVPCRVRERGASRSVLPADPAGYLIVGFDGQLANDAGRIREFLERWQEGETISLWVRRNPFLAAYPDWWEMNSLPVTLR